MNELASLTALSSVLDLTNGLSGEKSLLTGLFALELAQAAGFPEVTARAAFFTGLLRHLGCTGFSTTEARIGNDQTLRHELITGGDQSTLRIARSVTRAGGALGLARLISAGPGFKNEWLAEACGAARMLAGGLGLDEAVLTGLDEVFERFDGRGGPAGTEGRALSDAGRLAHVAHVAAVFFTTSGPDAAREALKSQSGSVLDPKLAKQALTLLPKLNTIDAARIADAEQLLSRAPLSLDALQLATVFGDFADLQVPYMRGHSRRVAEVCAAAAKKLGLDDPDLILAAHLHDLGKVTMSAAFWLNPGWTDAERSASRAHVAATERLLAQAPWFTTAAPIAAAHHERLDGSGFPRGLKAASLSRSSRLLAVAETFVSTNEARPHRPAGSGRERLAREAKAGTLDADCVAVVLGADGGRTPVDGGPTSKLSAREVEVLQSLAKGLTNKEIATALGLSARTVQHHSIHIYEKLGVSTRAAASLVAVRAGLL